MKNWIADRDELLGALLGRAREAARAGESAG
jgi:hypothetical protein